jgi:hypothetical protein
MQIAVFASSHLLGNYREGGLRSFARLQVLAIDFAIGKQLDPLNEMLVLHGMGNAADLDSNVVGIDFNDRYVFFPGGVGRILDKQDHLLTAAVQGAGATVDEFDNVTAQLTLVDFI